MDTMPAGRALFKLGVAILGGLVVVVGLILIPLPGPGWLIVFGGLAIWAVEFAWARHLLRLARDLLNRWRTWLAARHWLIRVPLIAVLAVLLAAIVWLSLKHGLGLDLIFD
jgi:uncharacterized protein (TIGR02611 family)